MNILQTNYNKLAKTATLNSYLAQKIKFCEQCLHFKHFNKCALGYSTISKGKPCRQATPKTNQKTESYDHE
jgi:recombinational DNA repair protein RecR